VALKEKASLSTAGAQRLQVDAPVHHVFVLLCIHDARHPFLVSQAVYVSGRLRLRACAQQVRAGFFS
jgi:hypothetical protein